MLVFASLLDLLVIYLNLHLQILKSRIQVCVDRHSHSLDDVRLFPPPAPLGMALPPDSSHSYTFGLPDATTNTKTLDDHSYYPVLQCQSKPCFYGRRSTNCLSLDTLGDEQFLEFILWTHRSWCVRLNSSSICSATWYGGYQHMNVCLLCDEVCLLHFAEMLLKMTNTRCASSKMCELDSRDLL